MCGIVAILGRHASSDLLSYLLEGIKMLQNRGYDSCGGVLLNEATENFWTWKGASSPCCKGASATCCKGASSTCCKGASSKSGPPTRTTKTAIERLDDEIQEAKILTKTWQTGIFQTRWATHGGKTDKNAHPHSDKFNRFFLVHNGIITNYSDLKIRLQRKGYEFRSETDTEVIVHMMVDCLVSMPVGTPLLEVWKSVISHLEGTWALLMCDRENPSWLYVAKNGSPLIMSYSENGDMIAFASEIHGIRFRTKQYEEIRDGSVFIVDDGLNVDTIGSKIEHHSDQQLSANPHPYSTWTELEINQQEQSLWNSLNHGGRLYHSQKWRVKLGGLEQHALVFKNTHHVILLGCGTSLYACQFASRVFRSVTHLTTTQVIDAAEFSRIDVQNMDPEKVIIIVVSQSGETKDCLRALEIAKSKHIKTVGVVNVVGSSIARTTDCGVYINAGREVGVASTKSFTNQCVVLTLIALWLSNTLAQDWAQRVYNIANVFGRGLLTLEQSSIELVNSIKDQRSIFILGRGYSHAIALEAALKLKELTYKNVEGYSGGALKHGPFSVLDSDATVFLQCWEGPDLDNMLSAAEQVSGRGAQVVILHNLINSETLQKRFKNARLVFVPAFDEWSASLVSIVFYQFLAYHTARALNLNPDQPRNLAKVVTVDG